MQDLLSSYLARPPSAVHQDGLLHEPDLPSHVDMDLDVQCFQLTSCASLRLDDNDLRPPASVIWLQGFWGLASPDRIYNPSYAQGSLWSSQTGQDFDTQFLSPNLFASYHYWPDLWVSGVCLAVETSAAIGSLHIVHLTLLQCFQFNQQSSVL